MVPVLWLTWIACALHVVLLFGMNTRYWKLHRPRSLFMDKQLLRWFAWDYKKNLAKDRKPVLAGASLTVAFACFSLTVAVSTSGLKGWGYLQLAAAVLVAVAAMIEALWAAWRKPAR